MLRKEQMTPGSKIRVRDVIKDGLGGTKGHLSLYYEPGGFLNGGVGVRSGAILTVVRGPKKKDSINCAVVRVEGGNQDLYGYWCELRASCDHVDE